MHRGVGRGGREGEERGWRGREEGEERGRRGGGEGEVKRVGEVHRGVGRGGKEGEERGGETGRQSICYYHSSNYTVLSIQ